MSLLRGANKDEGCTFGLFPTTGLQTTVGVDERQMFRNNGKGGLETVYNLLFAGNTWRVDVIDTGTDLVGVTVLLEGLQQLHIALGELDRNDIGIKTLNRREDIAEVRVAEVGVSLSFVTNACCGELKCVNGPFQVLLPV